MAFSSFSSARWKIIPSDSVPDVDILSCSINPSGHKTIRHLTIFSSSFVNSNKTVKEGIIKKISKFTTNHHGASSDIHKGDRDMVEGDSKTVVTVSHQLNLVPFVPFESKNCHLSQKKCLFRSKKFKSIILLNIISIVYASNIPLVKEVETSIDPAAFSAVRFAVSAIPFSPFVFQARDDRQTRNAGVELGLWVSLGYLIEALGLLTAEAGRASFISLFTVIVVPLLESLLGAVIPARTWFGVLMSVLGVVMLECSGSPPNVGDLLNFLSAIFFGIHMLRTEHISKTTKKENFMALLGYEVCVVAVLSTIWYLITGCFDGVQECDNESWTFAVLWNWMATFPWIPTLYTGVFSTGLCLWAEINAMRDVSATETAIIYGLEPLWGAGFAWFLLGERWEVAGWIGAALVLGGSLTVQLLGSTYRTESTNVEKSDKQGDLLVASDKKRLPNTLSTAPVIISFRKDVIDMLKKK